jgi:predicted nucleic acid-binding protein
VNVAEVRASTTDERGLLDTSVFIAEESRRPLRALPVQAAISVVTVAELYLGVLMADEPAIRAQRLRTLSSVEALFEPLSADANVARTFAELVAEARLHGRRPKIMDTWIAATALTHDLPVYTQDSDFLLIPRVRVVQV